MALYSSSPPLGGGRTALLIDLENLSYNAEGQLIAAPACGVRLDQVVALAGPVQHRLVAAQRHMLIRYGAELAARNLRWQVCPSGPDEADRALIAAGRALVDHGFGRIVVASGDHIFSQLGNLCDLRIAVPGGIRVSATLALAGTVLTAARGTAARVRSTAHASTTPQEIVPPAA